MSMINILHCGGGGGGGVLFRKGKTTFVTLNISIEILYGFIHVILMLLYS